MKIRQSNFELLRIVAMLMVLVVHADFSALDVPSQLEAQVTPGLALFRYLWEALAIVCVNVFVLISGWFGIRPSWKGFGKFVFQVLFFSLGVYCVACLCGWAESTPEAWLEALLCRHGLYWFIPSYILLYLMAPMLTAFVEKASERQLRLFLVAFYVFQTVYGFAFSEEPIFKFGYSPLSFAGLYLLAQYFRRYPGRLGSLPRWADMLVYLSCAALVVLMGFTSAYFAIDGGQSHAIAYNNPIVVVESLALLLFFSKWQFQSRIINYVSASAFAVFLLHLNPYFYFDWFKSVIISIAENHAFLPAFCLISLLLLAVFVAAVLIDQIRLILWQLIARLFPEK